MAGLIAGAEFMSGGGPHTRITRDPAWLARAPTAILTATPAPVPGRNVLRATPGPGDRFAERGACAAMPDGHVVPLSD